MEDSLQNGTGEGSDVDMQALFPDQCSLHIKQQIISSNFRKYMGEFLNFPDQCSLHRKRIEEVYLNMHHKPWMKKTLVQNKEQNKKD